MKFTLEKRPIEKLCFVDGQFYYEADVFYDALCRLASEKYYQFFLAPRLLAYLQSLGIVGDQEEPKGHLLLDEKACFNLIRALQQKTSSATH